MVDIHCHILPGIDDGAQSWEIAVQMCRLAREDGIEHIVATPHANSQFRYERAAFSKILHQLSDRIGGRPELSLGCDFHFGYENYLDLLHRPSEFTIGNTQYVLIELDDYSLAASLFDNLQQLLLRGLVPIITHPERHLLLRNDLRRLLKWSEMGCLIQVTADSILGKWGRSAKAATEWLIKHNAIHVIASDAHGIDSRLPILSKARDQVAILAGQGAAQALVRDNPLSIVKGKAISHSTLHPTLSL
jgi:protein-tyrosine phosphatase